MVVLELALLRIEETPADTAAAQQKQQSPPNPLTPTLLKDLTHALTILQSSSGDGKSHHPFTLLQQHEDPTNLYIVGSWPSIAAHDAFLPSAANQALLALLAGRIAVRWMQHVAFVPDAVDPSVAIEAVTTLLDGAPVLAIGRHTIAQEQRGAFQRGWEARRGLLEREAGRACVGGWRVGQVYGEDKKVQEQEQEQEEFVLLTGWDAVERHAAFAASEAFREYGELRQFIAGFDGKHASRVASSA